MNSRRSPVLLDVPSSFASHLCGHQVSGAPRHRRDALVDFDTASHAWIRSEVTYKWSFGNATHAANVKSRPSTNGRSSKTNNQAPYDASADRLRRPTRPRTILIKKSGAISLQVMLIHSGSFEFQVWVWICFLEAKSRLKCLGGGGAGGGLLRNESWRLNRDRRDSRTGLDGAYSCCVGSGLFSSTGSGSCWRYPLSYNSAKLRILLRKNTESSVRRCYKTKEGPPT